MHLAIKGRSSISREQAEQAVRDILAYIGEDVTREGLRDTPARFIRALQEQCSGYSDSPGDILSVQFSDTAQYCDEVILSSIPFHSHCEHHLAPFQGTVDISYIPKARVVGLSKLARLVHVFAKRLQIQEKMTAEIAQALHQHLDPEGVAVHVTAVHHCLIGRGIKAHGSEMSTFHFTGIFRSDMQYANHFKTRVLK